MNADTCPAVNLVDSLVQLGIGWLLNTLYQLICVELFHSLVIKLNGILDPGGWSRDTKSQKHQADVYAPLMLSSATLIASLNDLLNVGTDRTAVLGPSGHGGFGPQPIDLDPT